LYGRSGIGAWLYCLQSISLFAIICNCNLLARLSSHLHLYIPDAVGGGKEAFNDETYKVVVMLILDHLIVGVTMVMSLLIDDVPRWVRNGIARKHLRDRALLHQYVADSLHVWSRLEKQKQKQLQIHSLKSSIGGAAELSSERRSTNADTIGSLNHRSSRSKSDAASPSRSAKTSQESSSPSAKTSDSSPGSVKRSWFPSLHLKNT
jgi:hypothetical protein